MGKILVVDDEVNLRELLRGTLKMKGFEVITVPTAEQAFEHIYAQQFDLILLDINLAQDSGISVLKKIREHQSKVPVVIYSGLMTDEKEREARAAGANEVLSKSLGIPQIADRIVKIVNAKERLFQEPSSRKEKLILLVDDEAAIRMVLRKFLESKGYKVQEAENGEKAVEIAQAQKFSAVLLDMNMPGIDGLETLQRLLKIDPQLGVLMVTADQDDEKVKKALELGAYGYALKPFDFLYLELILVSKLLIAQSS
ncbi:MAG: response regulator [Candidatus Omnitrophica bacterium]|nr:response regulator [Candidatus Omnitrophota bacterium]